MLSKFYNAQQNRQSLWAGGLVYSALLLLSFTLAAQTEKTLAEMPKDERGKYLYYEVVEQSAIPADSLFVRAATFLKKKKSTLIKNDASGLNATGKMVINKTAFVLTHPSGEVLYNFIFEVKEGKYRFWLTDFLFIPYKRDRYSNFVPSTVKGLPLEHNPGKLNANEWASYVDAVNNHSALFAKELKNYLAGVQIKTPVKVLQKNNW